MLVIKSVRVKNFRSILDGTFVPGEVSVIVGENDVGKSNYIRALNLFFNGETDHGEAYNFASDFSYDAVVGKGKAKQTEIILHIQPPDTFLDKSIIAWKRYWRDGGSSFASESFHRVPGNREIPLKSKAIQWLRGIRFRYVPAIKGPAYFTTLLRDLHDTLAVTIDVDLRNAASDFIDVVRNNTAGISRHLSTYIDLDSRLQLPENLRSLFEVLDFSTKKSSRDVSLRLRGDGIKVRHIPAVLKFLADQERTLANPGRPKPTSVWGYEEPENNLEMKKAFEHAKELFEARSSAQIFVTTHSPAFYGLVKNNGVVAFNALPSKFGTQLSKIDAKNIRSMDDAMGLMAVVAPYIREKIDELNGARAKINELTELAEHSNVILWIVSGETDRIYFDAAMRMYDGSLCQKVKVVCIGSSAKGGSSGAGDSNLFRLVEQWRDQQALLSQRAIVFVDCDAKGVPVVDSNKLKVVQLQYNQDNAVARIGVENMLSSDVFTKEYYSETKKPDNYGGVTILRRLEKMRLCKAICEADGVLYARRSDILSKFKSVIEAAGTWCRIDSVS